MGLSPLDDVSPELERLWRTDPSSPKVTLGFYSHSPVHIAVLTGDHAAFKQVLKSLPKPAAAGSVRTEEDSVRAESDAEAASAVIDRRDVPGKESGLHVAVRMKDAVALELLMLAGADISLQNCGGWTALQEAVCAGEPALAAIIMREYQNLAWAKWLRRLPRLVGTMKSMRDFYMELTWNFESSVIPFISKIAPSDTYRIWKRGASLRADMTLEGFDGFRIKRANQSIRFLGEGSPDGKVKPGGVVVLMHKEREVADALEGMGGPISEADLMHDVADIFKTNVHRAGLDVTRAALVPVKTWRRQEKEEMVGPWKSKVIDMHHVTVSFRSRKVPGAMSDEELFNVRPEDEEDASASHAEDEFSDVLTEEERKQLKAAMETAGEGLSEEDSVSEAAGNAISRPLTPSSAESSGVNGETRTTSRSAVTPIAAGSENGTNPKKERKGWFSWGKKNQSSSEPFPSENDLDASHRDGEASIQSPVRTKKSEKPKEVPHSETEFSKGLKPTLWLTEDFPLRTEELLPLLDLLSPRVKAVRRLRELLTVKMPQGSFPVKAAIPIIPTIRVVVTVSEFREIAREKPSDTEDEEDQFEDAQSDISKRGWMDWVRGSNQEGEESSPNGVQTDGEDVFAIPADYAWVDSDEKRRRDREKKQKSSKKGKSTQAEAKRRIEVQAPPHNSQASGLLLPD